MVDIKWYHRKVVNGMRVQIVVDKEVLEDYIAATDAVMLRKQESGAVLTVEQVAKRAEAFAMLKAEGAGRELTAEMAVVMVQRLADQKSEDAKSYIAGKYVTPEQLARYADKYIMAKEYVATGLNASDIALEAELLGYTVDDYAALIITAGDAWEQANKQFGILIEAVRVKLGVLVGLGDMVAVASALDRWKLLDHTSTADDIRAVFA